MTTKLKLVGAAAAVLLSTQAFACPGVGDTVAQFFGMDHGCMLDKGSHAIQQWFPATRAILNPMAGGQTGGGLPRPPVFAPGASTSWPDMPPPQVPMGTACLTQTGFHPLQFPLPLGSSCSGTNQWGQFEFGVVR